MKDPKELVPIATATDAMIFPFQWFDMLDTMPPDEARAMANAVRMYRQYGIVPNLSGSLRTIWIPMKNRMDADIAKYEQTRKGRSEAGKKGMQSRWHGNNKCYDCYNGDNKNNPTESVSVSDIKETTLTSSKENGFSLTASELKKSKRFQKPTVAEVQAYAQEQGWNDFDPAAFVDHYEANGWKVGKNPMKDWQAAMRNWKQREAQFSESSNRPPPSQQPQKPLFDDDPKYRSFDKTKTTGDQK